MMTSFSIQSDPIPDVMLLDNLANEGARLVFIGLVRDYNKESTGVSHIEYSCYQVLAEKEGIAILQEAVQRFKVKRIACVHRIGRLVLQDVAIRLEMGSGHRIETLRACEYIMDEIKTRVPIWKKEFYGDKGVWL